MSLTIDDADNVGKRIVKKGKFVQDKKRMTRSEYKVMNKDINIKDMLDRNKDKQSKIERGDSIIRAETSPLKFGSSKRDVFKSAAPSPAQSPTKRTRATVERISFPVETNFVKAV